MYKAFEYLIIGLLCLSLLELASSQLGNSQEWELITPQRTRTSTITRTSVPIADSDWPIWANTYLNNYPGFARQPAANPSAPLQPTIRKKTYIDRDGNRVTQTITEWGSPTPVNTAPVPSLGSRSNFPSSDEQPEEPTTTVNTKIPTTTTTTSATNAKPTTPVPPTAPTTPRMPTLEEFLAATYGNSTTARSPTTTSTTTAGSVDESPKATTPDSRPVTTIKVEDLPITQILKNGEPADEDFIKRLPEDMRPANNLPNTPVFKIENIPRRDMGPNVRTITKTITLPHSPTAADLGPDMRDILHRAGIKPEDIENEDTIVKTRTEPDGRVVTTTYKRTNTFSAPPIAFGPVNPIYRTPQQSPDLRQPAFVLPGQPSFEAFAPTLYPRFSPPRTIDEFLSRLGLNVEEHFRHGECVKQLSDDSGRILTATFVLTMPTEK